MTAATPGPTAVQTARQTARWRALAELLRPDAWRWVGLGVLVAIGSALILTGPLIVREIVDEATAGTTQAALTRLAILFLIVAVATQLITMAVAWMATVTAWHTTNGIRINLARHVLGLSHGFHRQHTPGELIQRVDGDVTSVSDFMGKVIPRAAGALFTMIGMILVLVVVDWRLAARRSRLRGRCGRGDRPQSAPGSRRIIRRDGVVRPAVRRDRGAAHRCRGPPFQRRRRSCHVAVRRGQRRRHGQRRAPGEGLPANVVGRRQLGRRRRDRLAGRQCHAGQPRRDLRRRCLPAVPVRAAAGSSAGGHGRPAGDGSEGKRSNGASDRAAGRRAGDPRRRYDPATVRTAEHRVPTRRLRLRGRSVGPAFDRCAVRGQAARSGSSAAPEAARRPCRGWSCV